MSTTPSGHRDETALRRFNRTAEIATTDVIRTYSTSFGLASRLLGKRHRQHVRNIYAMVRIADEIVDGVAAEAGLDVTAQSAALDSYIAETHRSMRSSLARRESARSART